MPSYLNGFPTVLLCEDDPMIAIAFEQELLDHGLAVLGPFATCRDALQLLEHRRPSAAVIDVKLSDGHCRPVAQRLTAMGVPFLFFSGFDRQDYPVDLAEFAHVDWYCKPFPLNMMVEAVKLRMI